MQTGRLLRYVAGRVVLIGLAAATLSLTVFLLVHALPGNPFSGDERMTQQREQILLQRAGLTDPLPLQYVHWLQSYFAGGLAPVLWHEAWVSMRLGLLAIALMLVFGTWAGVAAAARRGTRTDHLLRAGSSVAYGVPNFIWAIWISFFFTAILYRWSGGLLYVDVAWHSDAVHWLLPAVALALPQTGFVARVVRSSMLDTLGHDYVRTAWAKGLQERAVLLTHALRNALIPVVTVMGPIAVATLMGSIVVENAFSIPGLGPELIQGIFNRAYFTVTGVFTFYSLLAGLFMLGVDVAYVLIDPKIRY
ncbi:MAG TPA: ABC transporter permease [Candidatus Dormibacteraeota bacterium]|nr:ABC transporter permease [Candidatus Dormibacteraeota bacterium]